MEPKYIKVYKNGRPLHLSQPRSVQSRSPYYFLKILFNIILPSMYIFLAASDTIFDTKTTYTPLLCPKYDTASAYVIVTCG
jgi:hypothetical protein